MFGGHNLNEWPDDGVDVLDAIVTSERWFTILKGLFQGWCNSLGHPRGTTRAATQNLSQIACHGPSCHTVLSVSPAYGPFALALFDRYSPLINDSTASIPVLLALVSRINIWVKSGWVSTGAVGRQCHSSSNVFCQSVVQWKAFVNSISRWRGLATCGEVWQNADSNWQIQETAEPLVECWMLVQAKTLPFRSLLGLQQSLIPNCVAKVV